MTQQNELSGKTQFIDRMRVSREHLEHLQTILAGGINGLRETAGTAKVCWGLQVKAIDRGNGLPFQYLVSPGLAIDKWAKPLILNEAATLTPTETSGSWFFVIRHVLRSEAVIHGIPTVLFDDHTLELRREEGPYEDGAVVFAQLNHLPKGPEIIQKGEWYLPPQNHTHTGQFFFDSSLRFRYDGDPVGMSNPAFDSGFIPLAPGDSVKLKHDLGTTRLLAEMLAREKDNSITSKGSGSEFWFNYPSENEVTLFRDKKSGEKEREYKITLWKYGAAGAGPTLPVANAGRDSEIEYGESTNLDGSRSMAFNGNHITRYIWSKPF